MTILLKIWLIEKTKMSANWLLICVIGLILSSKFVSVSATPGDVCTAHSNCDGGEYCYNAGACSLCYDNNVCSIYGNSIDGDCSACISSSPSASDSSDENKYICLDPTQYQGSKTVACACGLPDNTCDYFINFLQTGSNDLAGITFDANFDATTASTDAKSRIELFGGQLECCSDGKSAVYEDRSNVCADPSTFLPKNNFKSEDGSFDGTCDYAVRSISDDNMDSCYGEDFSKTWSCSGKSSSCQAQLLELARGGCCGSAGQSASACHGHYSGAGSFTQVGIFAISMAVAIAIA